MSTARTRIGRPPTISRDDILDAVIPRLSQSWTIPQIANDVGVSISSIYYYFANKQEIISAVGRRTVDDLRVPPYRGDWKQWLREYAREDLAHQVRNPFILNTDVARHVAQSFYWERVEEVLEILTSAGFLLADALSVLELVSGITRATAEMPRNSTAVKALRNSVPEHLTHIRDVNNSRTATSYIKECEAAIELIIDGAAARLAR